MKAYLKILRLFLISSVFFISCKEDDIVTEGQSQHPYSTHEERVEQVLNKITSARIKEALLSYYNEGVAYRGIGSENDLYDQYFIRTDKPDYTSYSLFLNAYSPERPYFMYFVVTIDRMDGKERAGYIKYYPNSNIQTFRIKDFTGIMEVSDVDGNIYAGVEFTSGLVLRRLDPIVFGMECVQHMTVTEVPCSHGGGHKVGESCNNGLVNDAHYEFSVQTVCNLVFGSGSGSGSGGSGGFGGALGSFVGIDMGVYDNTPPPVPASQIFYQSLTNSRHQAFLDNNPDAANALYHFLEQAGYANGHELANNILIFMITKKQQGLQILQFLDEEGATGENMEAAQNAMDAIQSNILPPNIINLIGKECQNSLVKQAYSACRPNSTNLNNVFMNIFEGSPIHNITYKAANIPSNGLTKLTSTSTNSNGQTVYNLEVNLNHNYLNTATDMAIAATVIHENIHAILLYLRYSNYIYIMGDNPTYSNLLIKYHEKLIELGQQPFYPMSTSGNIHHDFMAGLVSDIAKALKDFGTSRGYDLDDSYYNAMAWSGLAEIETPQGTIAINPAFVETVPNANERQQILDRIRAEKTNQNINDITPVSNGNSCN